MGLLPRQAIEWSLNKKPPFREVFCLGLAAIPGFFCGEISQAEAGDEGDPIGDEDEDVGHRAHGNEAEHKAQHGGKQQKPGLSK